LAPNLVLTLWMGHRVGSCGGDKDPRTVIPQLPNPYPSYYTD